MHSILGYPHWLTVRENNNPRKGAKTESEAGYFMDSKENKLYYHYTIVIVFFLFVQQIKASDSQ